MDDATARNLISVLEGIRDELRMQREHADREYVRSRLPLDERVEDAFLRGVHRDLARSVLVRHASTTAPAPEPAPASPAPRSRFTPAASPPQLPRGSAVMIAGALLADAQAMMHAWDPRAVSRHTIMSAEERTFYTREVRRNPEFFRALSTDETVFVLCTLDAQPRNWLPAFDVVAIARHDADLRSDSEPNGPLVYELLQGRL